MCALAMPQYASRLAKYRAQLRHPYVGEGQPHMQHEPLIVQVYYSTARITKG